MKKRPDYVPLSSGPITFKGTLKSFRKLLTDPPVRPGQRCRVCACPEVAAAVAEWAAARAAGNPTTLHGLHERYLQVVHAHGPSFGSVRGHVLRCLRLSPTTGKPLR